MKIRYTLIISLLVFHFAKQSIAQTTPFNCDYYAYLFQFNDVYSIDLASGSSQLIAEDITPGNINGAGYNSTDGFIWGSLKTPSYTIVKIGKDFEVSTYELLSLPFTNGYIGDIAPDGMYYLKNGGSTYAMIDLNPSSPSYLTHTGNGTLSQNINIHDWAFNAIDGKLYTVEKASNKLYRIDISNNLVEDLGEVPIMTGNNYTYGAVYFDLAGNFYVSSNQTGTIYIVNDVANITAGGVISSNLFAFGPSSSSNDGARCPTAPVPLEDCTNGVDDDGDGLVDCDDPSCSGVNTCPIIEATSGGNEGGLESNDRLAEKINKRNYNRVKTNYRFNKSTARRLQRTNQYAKSNTNGFILEDFIPIQVIGEQEVIESTPTDLIDITNASDILSVDYQLDNETIATVMAIKSENGVYEHTKNICDRLLGAELLSVSTIQIREKNFIRSIIKNTEGAIEFVLTFSAYIDSVSDSFALESHWNLDKYVSTGDYYNFQIWANSMDKLLMLADEIVDLLEVQKPIISFNLSSPPPVFVKKGKYENGALKLEIVNVNQTQDVLFEAGFKETETSSVQNMSSVLNLNESYLSSLSINTGQVFDIGFRIGDQIQTPDDVFMSDGPWGVDDFANSTSITNFSVTQNITTTNVDEKRIERNVMLNAETSEYVSVYKAFTPRFKAVDITNFNSFSFVASGNGVLDVRLVKKGISNWNDQFKYSIALTSDSTEYVINFEDFNSPLGVEPIFDDVITLVFTMEANGVFQEKELSIENIKLKNASEALSIINYSQFNSDLLYYNDTLHLSSRINENAKLIIVDMTGKTVFRDLFEIKIGDNVYDLSKTRIVPGVYLVKIITDTKDYDVLRIVNR